MPDAITEEKLPKPLLLPSIVKITNITKFGESEEPQISERELKKIVRRWKCNIVEAKGHNAVIEYKKERKAGHFEKITVNYLGGFSFLEALLVRHTSSKDEEFESVKESDVRRVMRKYRLGWDGRIFFEGEGVLHEEYISEDGSSELDVAFENPEYAQMRKIRGSLASLERYK